jgi:hypothetical protein
MLNSYNRCRIPINGCGKRLNRCQKRSNRCRGRLNGWRKRLNRWGEPSNGCGKAAHGCAKSFERFRSRAMAMRRETGSWFLVPGLIRLSDLTRRAGQHCPRVVPQAMSLRSVSLHSALANANGVPSVSPGLRVARYPGCPVHNGINPERVSSFSAADTMGFILSGLLRRADRVPG